MYVVALQSVVTDRFLTRGLHQMDLFLAAVIRCKTVIYMYLSHCSVGLMQMDLFLAAVIRCKTVIYRSHCSVGRVVIL